MKLKISSLLILLTAVLTGCTAPATDDEFDAGSDVRDGGGNDWDLSESSDIVDSRGDQDALASLVACGEPGDYINDEDLSALEGCERSHFQIIISGYLKPSIPELRSLIRSEDMLHVISAYNLTDLTDLSRLEYVGGNLMIRSMWDLTTLRGLESLRTVEQELFLMNLGVSDLTPLSSLTSVGGLYISLIDLTSLEGLASLERIDGDFYVSADGVSREELAQFLDRVEVTGTITLNGEEL